MSCKHNNVSLLQLILLLCLSWHILPYLGDGEASAGLCMDEVIHTVTPEHEVNKIMGQSSENNPISKNSAILEMDRMLHICTGEDVDMQLGKKRN